MYSVCCAIVQLVAVRDLDAAVGPGDDVLALADPDQRSDAMGSWLLSCCA
jgi:hypothetical protein